MNLIDLGWSEFFEHEFLQFADSNLIPARIARENKNNFIVISEPGELTAQTSGKMIHRNSVDGNLPVVGDWVAVGARPGEGTATIHALLPRKSAFTREAAGVRTKSQTIAANIDTVFLVCGLDDDFNLRRVERYLTTVWESGASPVICLNKADKCDDVDSHLREMESISMGIPVHVVSALCDQGMTGLNEYIRQGETVALMGSSGVGKSTIINSLLGYEKMLVKQISDEKSKGRHTTTHRELIVLDRGGILIDTPGMRALKLWTDENDLGKSFADVERLIHNCRYSDCRHVSEPDCAVREALENGELEEKRFQSYLKLQREIRHLSKRKDQFGRHLENKRMKKRARLHKQIMKSKNKKRE